MIAQNWIVGGALLCVAAAVWHISVTPIWLKRIPLGWAWKSDYIGIATYANEDGRFPTSDESSITKRDFSIVDQSQNSGIAQLVLQYVTLDPDNGHVTWESLIKKPIDTSSGEYAGADSQNEISLFPRHTQKRDYTHRFSYLKSLTMSFSGMENIGGLDTYLFRYQGRGAYT